MQRRAVMWHKRVFAVAVACATHACGATPRAPAPTEPAKTAEPVASTTADAPPAPTTAPAEIPRGDRFDAVDWSPTGRYALAHCMNRCKGPHGGAVVVWDLHLGKVIGSYAMPVREGHGGRAGMSDDERYLAGGGYDTIRVWRVSDGKMIIEQEAFAAYGRFSFSPDSKRMITGNVFGSVWLYALEDGRLVREAAMHPGAASLGVGFSWDGDAGQVGIHTEGVGSTIWDAATGKDVPSPPVKTPAGEERLGFGMLAEAHSHDGRVEARGNANGYLAITVDDQHAVLRRAQGPAVEAHSFGTQLTLSRSGRWLAVVQDSGVVELWDVPARSSRILFDVAQNGHGSTYVSFSRDEKFVTFARDERFFAMRLGHDRFPKAQRFDVKEPAPKYHPLGWSADGAFLLSTSDHRVVGWYPDGRKTWSIPTAEDARLLIRQDDGVLAVIDHDIDLVRLSDRRRVRLVATRGGDGTYKGAVHDESGEVLDAAAVKAITSQRASKDRGAP